MSKSSLQEYEEESEGVLVDWGAAESTKSVPARASKYEPSGRNAISLYDSDSSDELRRNTARRSSLLSVIRPNFTDDDHSVEDCMILSDDDDDDDDSEEEMDLMNRVQKQLVSTDLLPDHSSSMSNSAPNLSSEGMAQQLSSVKSSDSNVDGQRKGEITALFVEDKPWRESPWKRRKEKFSGKFRLMHSSSEGLEEDENGAKKPKGIFRAISLGATTPTNTPQDTVEGAKGGEMSPPLYRDVAIDPSADEDDEDYEEEVSCHSSQLSELDLGGQLEWEKLPPLPNSFLGTGMLHASMSNYLDDKLQFQAMSQKDGNQMAIEHSMLLRAILQLLEERQVRGVISLDIEEGVILKQGALKKFSHSVGRPTWKVKYAEVRRGSFCYYEDTADASKSARKTIPLAGCECNEAENKVGRYVFELLSQNSPRRLFMCSSEEERQAWMRVIQEVKEEKQKPVNLAPYRWSIDTYKEMQTNLRYSLSKGEYMQQFGDITKLKLQLPIQWSLEHASEDKIRVPRAPKSRTLDFWNFLDGQTLVMNGYSLPSESLHGPERIVGALARSILEYDKSSNEDNAQHHLSEVQAVSYARDVLMAVWQSRARDDSHYALDEMCQNGGLVIVLPMSSDPKIFVNVSYANNATGDAPPDYEVAHQMSGWVTSRSKTYKNWKNRYCVISEGVLSYYEHANPRPHGLRGQVVLVGASVSEVTEEKSREDMHLHILQILSKDQERERQLSFRDYDTFSKWRQALQTAIDLCTSLPEDSSPLEQDILESPESRRKGRKLVLPTGRLMKKGMEGGGRMMKGAAEGGFKVIKGASDLFEKITRQKTDERVASLSTMLESNDPDQLRPEPPSVQIMAESCRHYKIITSDPTGDDEKDTWVTVRATTCQIFKLSGGSNGRFTLTDELVALDFFEGLMSEQQTYEDQWEMHMSSSLAHLPTVSTPNRDACTPSLLSPTNKHEE